jgi:hypothetical protein
MAGKFTIAFSRGNLHGATVILKFLENVARPEKTKGSRFVFSGFAV